MAHQDALGLRFVLGLCKQEGSLEHAAAELVVAPLEVPAACIPGGGKQLPLDLLVLLQVGPHSILSGWMTASEGMSSMAAQTCCVRYI